jgi:hypothetical protein
MAPFASEPAYTVVPRPAAMPSGWKPSGRAIVVGNVADADAGPAARPTARATNRNRRIDRIVVPPATNAFTWIEAAATLKSSSESGEKAGPEGRDVGL